MNRNTPPQHKIDDETPQKIGHPMGPGGLHGTDATHIANQPGAPPMGMQPQPAGFDQPTMLKPGGPDAKHGEAQIG
jgi:hypothetical protein